MSDSPDPLLAQADRVLAELRERCAAAQLGDDVEELLIGGYASALALEGARRRLRLEALALSERELRLAAQERELREALRLLRVRMLERRTPAASALDDEAAAQRLDGRL